MIKFCKTCGKEFESNKNNQVNCSKECTDIAYINRGKYKHMSKDIDQNKKKVKLQRLKENTEKMGLVFDKTINNRTTYDKFKGVCQGCGKTCKFDVDSNHIDYPTVDHIVRAKEGGWHTWDNIQLLCRDCNAKKH